MTRFSLTDIQAQTILDMKLQRLTSLEREKIIKDYEEILQKIKWYKEVLTDGKLLLEIVREEFEKIKEDYGDERRTEIMDEPDEILPENLIAPQAFLHATAPWR